jgi:hypothetical protein
MGMQKTITVFKLGEEENSNRIVDALSNFGFDSIL